MKAEIKTKEKGFEPIELNITIESRLELLELCKRLNISERTLNSSDFKYSDINGLRLIDLWDKLNNIYQNVK